MDGMHEKRLEKSLGYSATCQAMSVELSLGYHMYAIAKLLHRSIFINGTMINMETWPNFREERLIAFERIEQTFFRKILCAHSKTPIEAIYLELGVIPFRFHLMAKRIMYLQEIMNRDDSELTKQVVMAQKERCLPGDFYAQVSLDMLKLSIEMKDLELSKEKLKELVTSNVRNKAFLYLIEKAKSHSKVRHQIYTNCDGAKHYTDQRFTPDLTNLVFRFRTRTFLVKNNYRNNYKNTDIRCPLCLQDDDTQEHIFKCPKLLEGMSEKVSCQVDDLYTDDLDTLYSTSCTLKKLVEIRENILNSDGEVDRQEE